MRKKAECPLAAALLLGAIARGDPGAGALPQPPPGWKLEVVAAAPAVRHPSTVCHAPDGRILVAEDPMDISAPSADLALGRILCIHPGGRITVFAEGLHAVFGMQYIDGKVYVLHNPRFSVFADGGDAGRDRIDLIESTNPNPWALDWNDHVPANFRLAMDGFLYVAVGDKGVYGAVGRDGRRVDLHGGGILRLRPDGTALEVYSTGVRNILDVAMNAEDEIFTYDNTDEQQWMSRVTHMVDGGFYGYPYDFLPRRPYTLWMMADYGGGAATGAFAYEEDALPEEHRGSLFLADFGKRQILRLQVAPEGATYRAASRQDVFADPPADFRPVGIDLAPDGLSIAICDWNHPDTKANVTVGRLLRLSYTGITAAAPKPGWHLPAAMGRDFTASTAELIGALSHPARSVRMVAQRRIAERGREAAAPLRSLLADRSAPARARWHALWALDAIDGGAGARAQIVDLAKDPDPSVRRQAIRQLGTRRSEEAVEALIARLGDPEASVRFQAAAALGRIGRAAAVPALLDALEEEDLFARYAAFTALGRIGRADPASWDAIAAGLGSERPAVREGTALALREIHDAALAGTLARLAGDPERPAAARAAALGILAGIHRRRPEWKGEWWAYHPVNAPPPRKSVEWEGSEAARSALRRALADPDRGVRLAAVSGLRAAGIAGAAPELREIYRREADDAVRGEILAALGEFQDPAARELIAEALALPAGGPGLHLEAIAAGERLGGAEVEAALLGLLERGPGGAAILRRTIEALGALRATRAAAAISAHARHAEPAVRRAAAEALERIGGEGAVPGLLALLEDGDLEIRRAAIDGLGKLGAVSAVPRLLEILAGRETRREATAALARIPDLRALDGYLDGLASRDVDLRALCRGAVAAIGAAALPRIEARLGSLPPAVIAQLQEVYRDSPEARGGPLLAVELRKLEPSDYLDQVTKSKGDPARGREVFSGPSGAGCDRCHVLGGRGRAIGPDLSTIGAQQDRRALAESILYPSRAVREGYQSAIVLLRGGETAVGLVKAETAEDLALMQADGILRRIPKSAIRRRSSGTTSLMPEGLHAALTPEDFADLIAYLESLK